jgi:hypothetical protein
MPRVCPQPPHWALRTFLVAVAVAAALTALVPGRAVAGGPPSARDWEAFLARGEHRQTFRAFVDFLRREGVDDVVPPEQLLRQGTSWREAKTPAFAFPPRHLWPGIVPTLRFLRDEVIPLVGPVEVVSGFRTRAYNRRAGGARRSKHLVFCAVDVVPLQPISRRTLHRRLLELWRRRGRAHGFGLGLYSGRRFHVDTCGYRRW